MLGRHTEFKESVESLLKVVENNRLEDILLKKPIVQLTPLKMAENIIALNPSQTPKNISEDPLINSKTHQRQL